MRISPRITVVTALAALTVGLGVAWLVLRPAGKVLSAAAFSAAEISPNADGQTDVVRIDYRLERPATVSIYFVDTDGARYLFRDVKPRDSGDHSLYFGGVVEPLSHADDSFEGAALARVLPDGEYTWTIEAVEHGQSPESITGSLIVSNAEVDLPEIRGLSVSPSTFTPNQDGLDDRATINFFLAKPASVHVALVSADGQPFPIGVSDDGRRRIGEPGLHQYDYDGGIDLGVSPPPDGDYTVVVEAEDAVGQRMQARSALTIAHGGLPRAEIVFGEVEFEPESPVLGGILTFTLTVENYGTAPIRTTGPASGTVYDFDQNSNSLGAYEEAGAFRVGIDCETCIRDYPWRWALGTDDELTRIGDHYYLMPGQRITVTGGVRITRVPENNPLYFWAGLIHEYVEVANVNNRVDPHFIKIQAP